MMANEASRRLCGYAGGWEELQALAMPFLNPASEPGCASQEGFTKPSSVIAVTCMAS
jgi:hypothetical protein